jgi:hypothetical protein
LNWNVDTDSRVAIDVNCPAQKSDIEGRKEKKVAIKNLILCHPPEEGNIDSLQYRH